MVPQNCLKELTNFIVMKKEYSWYLFYVLLAITLTLMLVL